MVVVQCVDDSGDWGAGGVFSALSARSKDPELQYELAGELGDVHTGDVHVIPCQNQTNYESYSVALLVAQNRNLKVKSSALQECLMK